jgi:RimJ/RimL family protein N-acetyltransferase
MHIETARLVLRRWLPGDVSALAEIHAHPVVAAFLDPRTRDDTAAMIERYEGHWETRGYGRFAVTDRATGRLLGRVGVMHEPTWEATEDKDEVGWTIAQERWGQGLATEAARAAIDDAFARVGLERIVSWTAPRNVASRRVMERCGMRYRGLADWNGHENVWYDVRAGEHPGAWLQPRPFDLGGGPDARD